MRISDWSSDVCSSDLLDRAGVGANLQDHIDYVSSRETRSADPFGDGAGGTWRMVKAIFQHRTRRSGIMPTCFAAAVGFLKSRPALPAPAIPYHFAPPILEAPAHTKHKGHCLSWHARALPPQCRGPV